MILFQIDYYNNKIFKSTIILIINMDQLQLSLEDLNQIIKMFSYSIQERIDELNMLDTRHLVKSDEEANLIAKYEHYKIKNDKEIQCVNKFCQRIMQIFSYFKGRSNHKNLLNLLEQKLVTTMDNVVTKVPIQLGQLIKLIIVFVKTPFQPQSTKKNAVELSMSSTKIKINAFERSKSKITYTNPFSNNPSLAEQRCLTSSAQPTKFIEIQKSQSRHLKTSVSGIHIRRNVSEVNKSTINKRPLRVVEEDLKCYSWLDLDKRYIMHTNQTINGGFKQGQERLQRQFMRRNESIKLNIQSYTRQFQDKKNPQVALKILAEVSLKKHNNVPQPIRKLKNGRLMIKSGMQICNHQGKREAIKKSRAHTSLKEDIEHQMTSNLFRQRKYRKAHQQNLHPRTSFVNSSFNIKNQEQFRLMKII